MWYNVLVNKWLARKERKKKDDWWVEKINGWWNQGDILQNEKKTHDKEVKKIDYIHSDLYPDYYRVETDKGIYSYQSTIKYMRDYRKGSQHYDRIVKLKGTNKWAITLSQRKITTAEFHTSAISVGGCLRTFRVTSVTQSSSRTEAVPTLPLRCSNKRELLAIP